MVGIEFITSTLDKKSLSIMFGNPILHNSFGEGFEKKDKIKESYASYMVTINDVKLHIGYDHRGTRIECLEGIKPDVLMDSLKDLVDIYKEKV